MLPSNRPNLPGVAASGTPNPNPAVAVGSVEVEQHPRTLGEEVTSLPEGAPDTHRSRWQETAARLHEQLEAGAVA